MAEWIELDTADLTEPEQTRIGGIQIQIGMSPFDVPDRVRGWYDETNSAVVVEFQYLYNDIENDEPTISISPSPSIRFRIGKDSSLLYKIEVKVDANDADMIDMVMHEIKSGVQRLSAELDRKRRQRNYSAAVEAVSKNAGEFLVGK